MTYGPELYFGSDVEIVGDSVVKDVSQCAVREAVLGGDGADEIVRTLRNATAGGDVLEDAGEARNGSGHAVVVGQP